MSLADQQKNPVFKVSQEERVVSIGKKRQKIGVISQTKELELDIFVVYDTN